MFMHSIGSVLFLYVFFRLVLRLPLKVPGKVAVGVWALGASQFHLAARVMGSLASPEMPYPLLVVWSASFVILTLLFAMQFARDAVSLGAFALRALRRSGAAQPFCPARRALMVAGLGAGVGSYGFHEGVRVPEVCDTSVTLARLPQELDGLTAVHLTDLHATALLCGERVAAIVDTVNDLKPDIIFCTGDLVDGTAEKRAADVAPLRNLRARYGVFACEGNHEYYSGHAVWMGTFADMGFTVLRNAHAVVDVRGTRVVVAGLADDVAGRFGMTMPDLGTALAGAPQSAPVVLLAHRPGRAVENARFPVDVQLSGHTHGGHIVGFDRVVASRNSGFVRGWYQVDAMHLYVNSGVGLWTGFPVRIGVPAEIARITFRSAAKGAGGDAT